MCIWCTSAFGNEYKCLAAYLRWTEFIFIFCNFAIRGAHYSLISGKVPLQLTNTRIVRYKWLILQNYTGMYFFLKFLLCKKVIDFFIYFIILNRLQNNSELYKSKLVETFFSSLFLTWFCTIWYKLGIILQCNWHINKGVYWKVFDACQFFFGAPPDQVSPRTVRLNYCRCHEYVNWFI